MLESIPWREVVEALFRQRRTLLGLALVVFAYSALSVWLTPPSYRAAARIQLTADPVSGPRGEAMSDKQLQAELAFLRSPVLIGRVLTKLDAEKTGRGKPSTLRARLREAKKRVREKVAQLRGRKSEADLFESRVRAAAGKIQVEPIGRSNLVEITYSSSSSTFAANFVNGLLSEHVERITELAKESPEIPFIQSQLDFLVERWQGARLALDAFRSRYGSSVLSGDEKQLRALVAQLESQRVAAETNVLELQARVEYLTRQSEEYPATVESELRMAQPGTVSFLEQRITELQIEKSDALTRYAPTSTIVDQINRKIEEAERLLASKEKETFFESATARNPAFEALEVEQLKTQAQLSAAQARVAALSGQITTYRKKLSDLEVAVVELGRLQNEVDSAQEAYQNYLREAETARTQTARDEFGMVNIAVIEPALAPRIAEPSRRRIRLVTGAVMGLLIGTVIALLRDWLDPSVKSADQVSRLTGARVLAEVPYQ